MKRGLVKKQIVDKRGKRTHVWVSNNQIKEGYVLVKNAKVPHSEGAVFVNLGKVIDMSQPYVLEMKVSHGGKSVVRTYSRARNGNIKTQHGSDKPKYGKRETPMSYALDIQSDVFGYERKGVDVEMKVSGSKKKAKTS